MSAMKALTNIKKKPKQTNSKLMALFCVQCTS